MIRMLLKTSLPHCPAASLSYRLLLSLPFLAATGFLLSCGQPAQKPRLHTFTGPTMGTNYTVKVVADSLDNDRRAALQKLIQARLAEVNSKMSHYLGDSELTLLNQWQSDEPYSISQETFEVLEHALESAGLPMAPSISRSDRWSMPGGFGPPGRSADPPDQPAIDRLLAMTGWEYLELLARRPGCPQARSAAQPGPVGHCQGIRRRSGGRSPRERGYPALHGGGRG